MNKHLPLANTVPPHTHARASIVHIRQSGRHLPRNEIYLPEKPRKLKFGLRAAAAAAAHGMRVGIRKWTFWSNGKWGKYTHFEFKLISATSLACVAALPRAPSFDVNI